MKFEISVARISTRIQLFEVEADSVEEAIEKAHDLAHNHDYSLNADNGVEVVLGLDNIR